ncbi:MAG: hypothetical protein ABIS67_07205 [Candidatus Eisenbacteria bacterium]
MIVGAIAAALAIAMTASAGIVVTESVEWLCESDPHVAIGRIERPQSASADSTCAHAPFRVRRTLKGNPPFKTIVICRGGIEAGHSRGDWDPARADQA